jgi:medium-chain acyl-[acyl-carrier-protein] hydrolase
MPNVDPVLPWIVRKPRPAARMRLFCFPYSGGGAAVFRGWGDAMPSLEVCAVQPPGREMRMREAPLTRMAPLVDGVLQAIRPLLDERPYALFGHSLGALTAFEVARAQRRAGGPMPRHLFASGCPAPHLHTGHGAIHGDTPIHTHDDAQLMNELRQFQGTPEEILNNDELMQLVLPLLRADFAVYETYAFAEEPPLDVPFSVLGGLEDGDATREELDGWRAHTTHATGCVLRMFRGNHFFLHPRRSEVLSAVLQDLASR